MRDFVSPYVKFIIDGVANLVAEHSKIGKLLDAVDLIIEREMNSAERAYAYDTFRARFKAVEAKAEAIRARP